MSASKRAVETDEPSQVRDARDDDLPQLIGLRDWPALLEVALAMARAGDARLLVYEEGQAILGFGLLMLQGPPEPGGPEERPKVRSLYVAEERRSQGVGSALLAAMEAIVAQAGGSRIYIGVDPYENQRALALYRRLGYQPAQPEPAQKRAAYPDEDGVTREHVYWRLLLCKELS